MITITKNLIPSVASGSNVVIMSDDDNVIEFTSSEENIRLDFFFRIKVDVIPQGSNTAPLFTYTTNRQYGYINLYSIINSFDLYPIFSYDNLDLSEYVEKTLSRSRLTVTITESWIDASGARFYNEAEKVEIGVGGVIDFVYIHKGIDKSLTDKVTFPIKFNINNNVDNIFRGWFRAFNSISSVTASGEIINPFSLTTSTPPATGSAMKLITTRFSTIDFEGLEVTPSDGSNKYIIGVDDCVENNFVNWLVDDGFYNVFNFEHSHEKGGSANGQNYYTDNKKTAIVSTSNTVTLTTRYVNDKTYKWLLEIIKSPSVYWNGVPVTPITKGFKEEQGRFEKLISLTIEFEISKRERSILL